MIGECELCSLVAGNIITKLYYKDNICIIVDCSTCGIPMVTYNFHHEPTREHQQHMEDKAKELFPGVPFRMTHRKIVDHPHFHILL